MVRNDVFTPERSVSFSKWQRCGVCFGKLALIFFFVPWEPRDCSSTLEAGDRAAGLVLAEAGTAGCRSVVVNVRLLSFRCLTFQHEEKYFTPLEAAVNGGRWLQSVIGIAGTLIPHPPPSSTFCCLRFTKHCISSHKNSPLCCYV